MDISEDDTGRAQRAIQSVEVGGRLLLALAAAPSPMTLKDLAAQAGLPPSRAHPYLVSYGRLGLVTQEPAGGRYALGPAALRIGLAALQQYDPLTTGVPVAQALAEGTGQAVAVAVWGNFGPTVIRMIDARSPLHVAMRPGTVMSMFDTATGRAFAAVQRRERVIHALVGTALGAGPGKVSPDLKRVDTLLQSARDELAAHGCTRAIGRPIPGVNAFSTPAYGHDGEPALVLTLLGHQDRVSSGWSSPMATAVKRAAREVSARLGYVARKGGVKSEVNRPGF